MINKLAEKHRDQFVRMVSISGTDIELQLPAAKPTPTASPSTKVLGTKASSTGVGESVTVRGIVSGAVISSVGSEQGAEMIFPIGTLQETDLVVRFYLEDVLVDPTKPFGKTQLDLAKYFIIGDEKFGKVGRIPRTGLPPLAPYILWVALKRVGEI